MNEFKLAFVNGKPPGPYPVVAVIGPTGAGKSQLGLHLAAEFGGEIVNCDSIQVYRGLEIGAAKVPAAQRRNIPHQLIDLIELDQELNAGAYSRAARAVLRSIRDRGRLPVIVGGTGFYLRALLDGLSPAPGRDEQLRSHLAGVANRRPGALHRFLRTHDPATASRIHPNDHQKLVRAIELILLARQPASVIQSQPRAPIEGFTAFKIGLAPDRSRLYKHLDERTVQMFRGGLLAETQTILDTGLPPTAKSLQSLGYKQAVRIITGQMRLDEAIEECQAKTRQYAKRQTTWFRAEAGVHWLEGFGTDEPVQREALILTQEFLATLIQ